jgi:hypothetical protein
MYCVAFSNMNIMNKFLKCQRLTVLVVLFPCRVFRIETATIPLAAPVASLDLHRD